MIILKYYEWLKLLKDERHVIWEQCDSQYNPIKRLTREDAQRLIKKHHLHLVFENKYGAIYSK